MDSPLAMTSLVEFEHINEMQEDLRRKLGESQRKDLGRMDSLRSTISALVVGENYDRARDEMEAYVALKTAFPVFQQRAERYVQHCSELIQAIKTKRNFPGLASLSLAKQQEIHEKVIEHFEELKMHLKHIEKIEHDCKVDDVRSTIWVVRAACHGTALIFLVGLFIDIKSGGFSSFMVVTDHTLDVLTSWLSHVVKF